MRLIIILFFFSSSLSSQTTLTGIVIDSENNAPLEGVVIRNINGNQWAVSDKNGGFELNLKNENILLEFRLLGKQTLVLEPIRISEKLIISLKNNNLNLDEVTVTAIPKRKKVGSAVSLGQYAVDQVQAFSLADILKQLSGQEITAPSLNSPNIISLRTAQPNQTNAFGVSYMIDGVPLSNDENMQQYNPNPNAIFTGYENASTGIDLRSIPAVNIEEVEVISGIPDAKYGNLTSGLIRITRKAGVAPLTIHAGLRQGNSTISFNRGFRVSDKLGTLSLSLDYLNANSDPRKSLEQYDRITGSAIWTVNTPNKNIRNTFSLTLHNNFDDTKYDKNNDDGGRDAKFRKDRGIQLSNRFNWKSGGSLFDNFTMNVGYSYAYQHSYTQSFINDGGRVVPESMETGLFSANYTPVAYLQIKQVYGQPVNFNVRASVDKIFSTGGTTHNASLGVDGSYSDNTGRGRGYNPENAHTQLTLRGGGGSLSSDEGMRALDYDRYVDPRINFGFYFQDNITHIFENGKELYANLGLRYDVQNSFSSFSPRLNLGYELSEKLSIRGALGFASKAPSLAQIYPGDKYFDVLIRDFRTSSYSFNLVQTYKKAIDKVEIAPSKSWKYELGTNYNTDFGSFALTSFYNYSYDGVQSYSRRERVDVPEVEFYFPQENMPPIYEITGYSPLILDYSLSTNAGKQIDKGIEFYINFNKIKSINTSFGLNGTYVYSKSSSDLERIIKNNNDYEENMLYGYYERLPTKSDMFRLRAMITHHLSELGLLISFTVEQFTREMNYATSGSIYPYAYMDKEGNKKIIPEAERQDINYSSLWLNPSRARNVLTPTYHNFHLRATKELTSGISMSLYANNFLNYRPVISIGNSQERKNSSISFGAQIKYQF